MSSASTSVIRKYNEEIARILALSRPSRQMLTIALFGKGVISDMEKQQVFDSSGVEAANSLVTHITSRIDGENGKVIWNELEGVEALKEIVKKMKQEVETSSRYEPIGQISRIPSDILRRQLPNLSNTVANVEGLAERLKASELIPAIVVDNILEETPARYKRASRLFSEIHRCLTVQIRGMDTRETLRKLCEVLKEQNQRELTQIADQMLEEV